MEQTSGGQTPSDSILTVLVIHISKVYKALYGLGNKLSKRDKLGIHKTIEESVLRLLQLSIKTTFSARERKSIYLEEMRVSIEVIKILVRTEHELKIIPQKTYLILSHHFVEISKMTNGWLKFVKQKPPR